MSDGGEFTPHHYAIIAKNQAELPQSTNATIIELSLDVLGSDDIVGSLRAISEEGPSGAQVAALNGLMTALHRRYGIPYVAIEDNAELRHGEVNIIRDPRISPRSVVDRFGVATVQYVHNILSQTAIITWASDEQSRSQYLRSQSLDSWMDGPAAETSVLLNEIQAFVASPNPVVPAILQYVKYAAALSRQWRRGLTPDQLEAYRQKVLKTKGYAVDSTPEELRRRGHTTNDQYHLLETVADSPDDFETQLNQYFAQISQNLPRPVRKKLSKSNVVNLVSSLLQIWMV